MLRRCVRPETILILLLCLPLGAEPLHTYDFEDASAAAAWNHKDNTTLDVRPPQPFQGQGALRFIVDPTKFSYGWVHTPLPEGNDEVVRLVERNDARVGVKVYWGSTQAFLQELRERWSRASRG